MIFLFYNSPADGANWIAGNILLPVTDAKLICFKHAAVIIETYAALLICCRVPIMSVQLCIDR